MKILLAEYATAGGLDPRLSDGALIAEGLLMRNALLADLLDIPHNSVTVLHDEHLGMACQRQSARVAFIPVTSDQSFELIWQDQLARCHAAWPIAPETDGILERLCRDAGAAGAVLLTSPAQAVKLTGSKRRTLAALARCGIPTVPTQAVLPMDTPNHFPVVVKPDDGVGCAGSRVLRNAGEWRDWLERTEWHDTIVQPLIEGESRSLSALFARGQACVLSGNRQHARIVDSAFVLEACSVNLTDHDRGAADRLAAGVAAVIPELWGYAGIDFIESDKGPVVLEVNPRLTTSYVGLREALGINVAAMVQDLCTTGLLPPRNLWRGETVEVNIGQKHGH